MSDEKNTACDPTQIRMQMNENAIHMPFDLKIFNELSFTFKVYFDYIYLYNSFKVDWPASLIVTEPQIKIYESVFRLLLSVEYSLHVLIHDCCPGKAYGPKTQTRNYKKHVTLRNGLMVFIKGFKNYILTNVIYVALEEFKRNMNECSSFSGLVDLHEQYVISLRDKCFLNPKVSMRYTIFILDCFYLVTINGCAWNCS